MFFSRRCFCQPEGFEMQYLGKGILSCPECLHARNIKEKVYPCIFAIGFAGMVSILRFDAKLTPQDKTDITNDILGTDYGFDVWGIGVYVVDVYLNELVDDSEPPIRELDIDILGRQSLLVVFVPQNNKKEEPKQLEYGSPKKKQKDVD